MYTKSKYTGIYLGRNAGKYINESLDSAKHSVKIVSPFLAPQYIKKLVHLKERGVDVTLITSDKLEESKDYHVYGERCYHTDIIKQDRALDDNALQKRNKNLIYSIYFFAFSICMFIVSLLLLILLGLNAIYFLVMFFSILGATGSSIWMKLTYDIRIYSYSYHPIFRLKVFFSKNHGRDDYLIHSKIYVIDDRVAFLGSTNFTYTGFVKSYESTIKISDFDAVKSISEEVEKLFNMTDLYYKNIHDWGRQLYHELPHEGSILKMLK